MPGFIEKHLLEPRRKRIAKNKAYMQKHQPDYELNNLAISFKNLTINKCEYKQDFNTAESDINPFESDFEERKINSIDFEKITDLPCNINQINLQEKMKIILETPHFSGDANENFEQFIGFLELKSAMLMYNEEEKLLLLTSHLLGEAAKCFKEIVHTHPTLNWTQAVRLFQNSYIVIPKESVSIKALKSLKQEEFNSLEAYAKTIQIFVNKLFPNKLGYNDHIRLQNQQKYFINGTAPTIRRQLQHKKDTFKTFEALLNEAINLQNAENLSSTTQKRNKNPFIFSQAKTHQNISTKKQYISAKHRSTVNENLIQPFTKAELKDKFSTMKEKSNNKSNPKPLKYRQQRKPTTSTNAEH